MVHINPKFANRALPPIPVQKSPTKKSTTHVNPNFLEGKKVQKSPIKKSTTHVNPSFLDGKIAMYTFFSIDDKCASFVL